MQTKIFTDYARITSDGQVTIPKDVRKALGVSNGDRITFVVDGNNVRIANSAVYAMQQLQEEMEGVAELMDLKTEDDVVALIKEIRAEDERIS
ncbi:MAG: AbrB/MazE/SpoVT family DNA-binding domain-containing protein [Synergistaceae bacterium]|nr:AbrB/MazE/SpoVT family DNA-binding domain-containing protein [Synergistaceae bacterium]